MNWNTLDEIPPNESLELLCDDGRIIKGTPTYYPFDTVKMPGDERKPFGLRATLVFYENGVEKWDGGWLIPITLCDVNVNYNVIKWRRLV